LLLAGRAAGRGATEYEVKAAFLLNFAKFVDWPPKAFASPDSPIAICVFGTDPFGSNIDEIVSGEATDGRRLIVRRIIEAPAPRACQIFFTQQSGSGLNGILASLGPGVLTVGEGDGFLRDGGMIAFVIENRRVRFDISQRAADAASLKLSSRLLTVARAVER
jgi:hypothetical protein